MKIRELTRETEVVVVAVYWAQYQGARQRHFLVVPYDGYEGLIAVAESECEITDSSLDGFRLVKGASQQDMLVLSSVLESDLLDRMIEHDPTAMVQYREMMADSHPPPSTPR